MRAAPLLLTVAVACAAPAANPSGPGDPFTAAAALEAAERAPDFFARAERARADADRASGAAAAADHRTRARLLLEAAIAEAQRIELDRSLEFREGLFVGTGQVVGKTSTVKAAEHEAPEWQFRVQVDCALGSIEGRVDGLLDVVGPAILDTET